MSNIPGHMRAAAIDRFGGPEVLTIHEMAVPAIDQSEVLIALDTSGVGPWDADIREGWHPGKHSPPLPLVPGTDGAGEVLAVGKHVKHFKVGDLVYTYSFYNPFKKGGFYAENVVVPAEMVGHIPENLDLVKAGAIATTGLTALQGIDDHLKVTSGQIVLIHGASGGVGTLAVQFAKLRGARVLATASGGDGVSLVQSLGADDVVDGRSDKLQAALERMAPDGVDAVLGLSGGKELELCLKILRRGGTCAYPNGIEPEPQPQHGIEIISYDAVSSNKHFKSLNQAVEEADLQVPIADSYALEFASTAHERLEAGHVLGKIVLRILR